MLRDIRQFRLARASRHAIAQVDGNIHSACADVRDNGEAHDLLLLCDRKTSGYLESRRGVACVTEPPGPSRLALWTVACYVISESRRARCCLIVMAGLGPAIHDFAVGIKGKTWMAGLRRP
jgi:hypothetical protein